MLGLTEKKIVIAVGQFIHRKGFDVLINAASLLPPDVGVYIIGGTPTAEYIKLKHIMQLTNVHFIRFMSKNELANYYKAADCTAFPTREDIWGLITNESMAYGVPVVATNRCISALELIDDNINGYIVPVNDHIALANAIKKAINTDCYVKCIQTAQQYTIEMMAKGHLSLIKN